jgi:hypothetical protein
MQVDLATVTELTAVQAAYAEGRRLQRAEGSVVWPEFADSAILDEMTAGRLLRVVDGDTLVGVFSVAYQDPAIWEEREQGCHI